MERSHKRADLIPTGASISLDALRGIAALLVVLDHVHHLFFAEPAVAAAWLLRVSYVIASAGPQAVTVFFILSGYLISKSVCRSLASGTWSWRDYLTRRLVRRRVQTLMTRAVSTWST